MYTFRKTAPSKSVMFAVNYDDGRTAYMWIDGAARVIDDRIMGPVAKERQEQGLLPAGTITGIKRVR
jgi:hypothetical protein